MKLQKAAGFSLANETKLAVIAADKPAYDILSHLIEVMQLQQIDDPALKVILVSSECKSEIDDVMKNSANENASIDCKSFKSSLLTIGPSINKEMVICKLSEQIIRSDFYFQVYCTSMLIGLLAMNKDGMLIHGGLAEKDGCGIILAGHSGAGKTTASNRIPKPWRSLSDDMTVIARDSKGVYWAHPLPSHSRFANGQGGIWDVQHCVPLKGIFFLSQSKKDSVQPLIIPEAVILSIVSANQALRQLSSNRYKRIDQETRSALHKQLFNNSCTLFQSVPAFLLDISLYGEFWKEIDRALNGYSTQKAVNVHVK